MAIAISTLDDYIDDLANTDTTSFSDTDKHAAMTRWAHTITQEVLDAQNDWDFQGEIATASLVANQREYIFPSDLLTIKRVDLKLDGTNWTRAAILDESEISEPISTETNITDNFSNDEPYIALMDGSFFIYSGTVTTVADGIKIWYGEEVVGKNSGGTDIASFSADTDVPNIVDFGKMALVYGAILDHSTRYQLSELKADMNNRLYANSVGRPGQDTQVGGLIGRIRNFYSNRAPDKEMIVKPASDLSEYQ